MMHGRDRCDCGCGCSAAVIAVSVKGADRDPRSVHRKVPNTDPGRALWTTSGKGKLEECRDECGMAGGVGAEPRSAQPDGGTNEVKTHHPYSMQDPPLL